MMKKAIEYQEKSKNTQKLMDLIKANIGCETLRIDM